MSEHELQKQVVDWAKLNAERWPELDLLYAIPNGARLSSKREAAKLKAEGMNNGVPDLCLPSAHCGAHGLYIEMKYGDNKPSERQVWWMDRLNDEGYITVCCWTAEDAIQSLIDYLSNIL